MKKFSERQILNSKSPEQFIDRCVNSDLSRGDKIKLGREWREKTGYTLEDLDYARNRHPYWKKKKMNGWKERNDVRWNEHNYSTDDSLRLDYWTENNFAVLKEYVKTDKKLKSGKYKYKDREIAEMFKTSIPSVQHLRRKSNMVTKILSLQKEKDTLKTRLELMKKGETSLRMMLK